MTSTWRQPKKPTRALSGACLGLTITMLAACASGDKPKPPPEPPRVLQAPGKGSVTIDAGSDGRSVLLEPSQVLRVDLPLADEAVSSNLEWRISQTDPAVLDSVSQVFERGSRDSSPSEAGGTVIWRLKAKAPGHVDLAFELRRPRTLTAPTQTLHFDVTVK